MAKRKSPQELMAQRNPLNRTAVAPVDIYSQQREAIPQIDIQLPKPIAKSSRLHTTREVVKSAPKPKTPSETDNPYSTYLFREQVKGIKLRAIEQGVKDKHIVQQAIDEYFKNHPL